MADDATRVRLEGEDASGPAFQSVANRLKGLEREAKSTSEKLSGSASLFDDLGKGIEQGLGRGLRQLTAGMGPAARAAASAIIPLGTAAMAAATAAGVMGAAYNEGSKELDGYRRALLNTGNALGMTAGQMAVLAAELKSVTNTQGAAAESLTALAATGKVGSENLGHFAAVAVEMQRTLGVSVSETAKQFAELGQAPTEASAKLTQTHRYLTLEVYNQIRALEEQGRKADAAAIAQEAWARDQKRIADEVAASLGPLERAWQGVKDAAKSAWDNMLGIGRGKSIEEQLAAEKKLLADMTNGGGQYGIGFTEKQIEAQRQRVAAFEQFAEANRRWAQFDKERADAQQAGIEAQRANAKWAQAALTNQEKLNRALEEYRANNEKIRAAGGALDPAQVAREEAAIRASFKDRGGSGGQDRTSDFERYMKQLDDQIAKVGELTTYERLMYDLEAGGLKNITQAQFEALRSKAELVDATRAGVDAAKAEAEMQALLGRLRQKEIDDNARLVQQMEAKANGWLDQLDPMREFIRHIEDVDRVVEELSKKGWIFTPEQIAAMKELGNGVKDETKKADDAAKQLGLTFQSAFEDAIIEGKKFSEVLGAIGQDLLRLTIRKAITEPVAGWLASVLNPFGGGKASGGSVAAGTTYLVGEHGPELITPKSNGWIVPNDKLGGRRLVLQQTFHFGGNVDRAQMVAFGRQIQQQTIAIIRQANHAGDYALTGG